VPTPKTPNLFDWATSELSQDAFICWLLSWANHPKDDGLYRTARMLVTEMTNDKLSTFKKIEIKKQLNRADVVCFIDEKDILIIEDKTGTREHSGQLKKYAESFGEKFSNRDLYLIYYKTEDQSDYSDVIKAGYTVWNREKILQTLQRGIEIGVNHPIYADYFSYLKEIQEKTESFNKEPFEIWRKSSYAWAGFFKQLKNELKDGNWDYVPNASGGFMGFWWHWKEVEYKGHKIEPYLQLEEGKLCFKMHSEKEADKNGFRELYRSYLFDHHSSKELGLVKSGRLGSYMTVASTTKMFEPESSKISLKEVANSLRGAMKLLDDITMKTYE
jgi:hypothetical protein